MSEVIMSESETGARPITDPITMCAPLVRALLEGRKTPTRRIIKEYCYFDYPVKQPDILDFRKSRDGLDQWIGAWDFNIQRGNAPYPYGQPRDCCGYGRAIALLGYKASESMIAIYLRFGLIRVPRGFSRLTRKLTEVLVHQVNDMSEADAIAEGL
jgi:hypothetical protein